MALYENGYKNNLVTFGLELSPKLLTTLVTLNPKNIIIATNNDSSSKSNRGLQSAVKIFLKLIKYFNIDGVTIQPPVKNDFGAMQEQNVDFDLWYNKNRDKKRMYKYILDCSKDLPKTLVTPTSKKLIQSRLNE